MNNLKVIALLLFIGINTNIIYSQDKNNILIIENKIHFGKVMNYFPNNETFPKRKSSISNEIYIGYKAQGKKSWHNVFNFPEVGASFFYISMGNNKQLGHAFGIVPNMNINLFKVKKQNFKFHLGFGLGYYSNPYDSISNPYNIIIGSKIMNLSFYGFSYQYKLNKKLHISTRLSFIHGSNGHFKIPNAGVNMPTASIGIKYYFKENKILKQSPSEKIKDRLRVNIVAGIGKHQLGGNYGPYEAPIFSVYTSSLFLSKIYSQRSNLLFGVSLKYYKSYQDYIKDDELLSKNINLNASVFTVFVGYELIMNKLGLYLNAGYNVHRPALKKIYDGKTKKIQNSLEERISTKLGFRFFAFNPTAKKRFNPYIGIAVKAILTNADFPELSCGVTF